MNLRLVNKLLMPILLIGLIACSKTPKQQIPLLHAENKFVLQKEGTKEFLYWEMENTEKVWTSERKGLLALEEFRDSLQMAVGPKTYQEAIAKESTQSLDQNLLEEQENGDRINALLVHTGRVGEIRAINNLEAHILNYQISRYPFLSHPTEFHGFILQHDEKNKIRVYFGASDAPWPPKPYILIEKIEEDVKQGWRLKQHLHNHYEPDSNNYVGVLAPSLADAHYYKNLHVRFPFEKALITNGFHTVEIPNEAFPTFESH